MLRLLGSDLDGPGIARELVVSLSTIRSHTKAIYAKLGVTSRRAAVRRGAELASCQGRIGPRTAQAEAPSQGGQAGRYLCPAHEGR